MNLNSAMIWQQALITCRQYTVLPAVWALCSENLFKNTRAFWKTKKMLLKLKGQHKQTQKTQQIISILKLMECFTNFLNKFYSLSGKVKLIAILLSKLYKQTVTWSFNFLIPGYAEINIM